MLSVQNNIAAMMANRYSNINTNLKGKAMNNLSSGYRINKASDDAAGLCISEKMRSQIRGLDQASNNVQNGISLCQVADGAMNEVHDILIRMDELATKAANDTNTYEDRAVIQKEIDALGNEISRIGTDTEFNTIKIFDGSYADTESSASGTSSGVTDYTAFLGKTASIVGESIKSGGVVDLDSLSYATTLNIDTNEPVILTGTYSGSSIKCNVDGANIVLNNCNVSYAQNGISFQGTGNKLQLMGVNTIDGVLGSQGAGVYVPSGADITISGSGSLVSIGGKFGAGIGGSNHLGCDKNCGDIIINGGTIHADGDYGGAGIGGAEWGSASLITINGGNITASGTGGAGIGSGNSALGSNVIINGGQIYSGTAHINGETGEAIGSGDYKLSDSTVTINGSGYTDTTGVFWSLNAYREILYPSSGTSGAGGANNTNGVNIPAGNGLWIQTGASTADGFHLSVDKMDAVVLGVKPLDVGSHSAANAAIGKVSKAIETLSTQRSKIGAQQNRLEYVYNVDLNSSENLQNSESKVRDADMAKEMVTFSKQSVLEQASQAMLAQANQSSNGILKLLS